VAIDLGSNSFHLLRMRLVAAQWQVEQALDRKVQLGLGMGLDGGLLASDAIERGLSCLGEFAIHTRGVDSQCLRVVATQALRQASNRDSFLVPAEQILQQSIDVIGGEEEAGLVYLGVRADQPCQGASLVVDIGGGSTELALGDADIPGQCASVPVGCVSLLGSFSGGRITADNLWAARSLARQSFDRAGAGMKSGWQHCIGSSGTLLAVEQVLIQQGWSQQGINRQGLQLLERALLGFDSISTVSFPGLSESRRSVFATGLAITLGLFDCFDIQHMNVSSAALKDGVARDLLSRNFVQGQ
jgi:exopolyphosphatase/guanosine-5'-triphosphate,3'-diphosphate pyrophosphatase